MIKSEIEKAFNAQINREFFSSYLYLSMSAYFQDINLLGFAHWMRIQAQEELLHATKMFDFVLERGGRVILDKIDKPENTWQSPIAAFEAAYKHEIFITENINNLVSLAIEHKDYASNSFLQWFVNEQVEEEATADEILKKLKLLGDAEKGAGIFMLDKELSARVFTMPAATEQA